MVIRLAGWNMLGSLRPVMMRVFEGGDGWMSGGRLERSRLSCGDLDPLFDVLDDRDSDGDGMSDVESMFMVFSCDSAVVK